MSKSGVKIAILNTRLERSEKVDGEFRARADDDAPKFTNSDHDQLARRAVLLAVRPGNWLVVPSDYGNRWSFTLSAERAE